VKISVVANATDAAARACDRIASALQIDPALVLGLAAGRTPLPLYRRLSALHRRHAVDFALATTFNLDEFVGLEADHASSYRTFMDRHFFGHVNVSRDRINFLDGMAPNLDAECARYDAAIIAAGGIGLQILGLGTNGHIGFNEPGPSLIARTHRATLAPATRRANAPLFGGTIDRVPHEGLTMGIASILAAREIVLIATGRGKARPAARLIEGPVTTRLPASFLQLHPNVEIVLDEAAAGGSRK
jgi:glucosamine-6-phosphate deaminase